MILNVLEALQFMIAQVLSKMADHASKILCSRSRAANLSMSLEVLNMHSLAPEIRNHTLHQSAISVAEALSI